MIAMNRKLVYKCLTGQLEKPFFAKRTLSSTRHIINVHDVRGSELEGTASRFNGNRKLYMAAVLSLLYRA